MNDRHELYIGGRWVTPHGRDRIVVVDPVTTGTAGTAPAADVVDIDAAVTAARTAFDAGPWPWLSWGHRAGVLERLLGLYRNAEPAMVDLIVNQMGSPIRWARETQMTHPIGVLGWHAAYGRAHPHGWDTVDGGLLTQRIPVGVVAVITPWNMPQKTIMMKVAPALLAGCTVVVKPATETPLDALALADLVHEAGFPPGVFNVVTADRDTSELLVRHPGVDKVAFTGSTAVGQHIAGLCGADVRRYSLELGGKSAAIVCDDADLDAFTAALPGASLANSGQICSNHTRILAPARRYREVLDAVVTTVAGLTVGHPRDDTTDIGPLVSMRQRDRVNRYLRIGAAEGAMPISAPVRDDRGWWVPPTVFANVHNRMTVAREEIFGPVLCIIAYNDDADAVAIANDSPYGLDGGVWSTDPGRALRIARQLRVGNVSINGAPLGLNTPLGGFKQSGVGRELGEPGLAGYVETRVVATHLT